MHNTVFSGCSSQVRHTRSQLGSLFILVKPESFLFWLNVQLVAAIILLQLDQHSKTSAVQPDRTTGLVELDRTTGLVLLGQYTQTNTVKTSTIKPVEPGLAE